jgi:hypothetical protein
MQLQRHNRRPRLTPSLCTFTIVVRHGPTVRCVRSQVWCEVMGVEPHPHLSSKLKLRHALQVGSTKSLAPPTEQGQHASTLITIQEHISRYKSTCVGHTNRSASCVFSLSRIEMRIPGKEPQRRSATTRGSPSSPRALTAPALGSSACRCVRRKPCLCACLPYASRPLTRYVAAATSVGRKQADDDRVAERSVEDGPTVDGRWVRRERRR